MTSPKTELEHATKEFEKNNAFTHKRLTELQTENQQLKQQIADANQILNLAEFEDLTGAHKIHWSNWLSLRGVLQSTATEKTT